MAETEKLIERRPAEEARLNRKADYWRRRAEAEAAEVSRLREALALAANRLDRLALELPFGGTLRSECTEWADEARGAQTEEVRA